VANHSEIDQRLARSFAAAEAFARLVAPDEPGRVEDLWLHRSSPAPFAATYPGWYLRRWKLDLRSTPVDWDAPDVNVWSDLQDCLGVRGLVAVVSPTATPPEIMAALDRSRVPLPDAAQRWAWVTAETLRLGAQDVLAAAAGHVQQMTGRRLVRLCDFWSADDVVTTLVGHDLPRLRRLACAADFLVHTGLRVLDER